MARRESWLPFVETTVSPTVEPAPGGSAPAVRSGDSTDRLSAFFDHAIGEVFPYLYRRCGHDREVAEDLTQDTFVTAVRALREGRIEELTVGWLITCAQSRFIDHCRRADRLQRHLRSVRSTDSDGPEDDVVGSTVVTELLAALPPGQRMVVVLHHLDGLTVRQISARTGRSVRSIESSLARARRAMRRQQEDVDEG